MTVGSTMVPSLITALCVESCLFILLGLVRFPPTKHDRQYFFHKQGEYEVPKSPPDGLIFRTTFPGINNATHISPHHRRDMNTHLRIHPREFAIIVVGEPERRL